MDKTIQLYNSQEILSPNHLNLPLQSLRHQFLHTFFSSPDDPSKTLQLILIFLRWYQ